MNIGIAGCMGRMGRTLVQEILSGAHAGAVLSGGTALPQDIQDSPFFMTDQAQALFDCSDALIDFTAPQATIQHARIAADKKKILIIGTTGLTAADQALIAAAAQKTTIVQAANFSVGVNMALALVEKTAATLGPEWDIEVFEAHHKHKVDAPSGTALALAQAAQKGRGQGDFVTDRHGVRKKGDIGFAVARGGDVVGEHTVTFYGTGERVSIGHISTDRGLYARGAICAALWAAGKPPGLYNMRDVLGI